MNRLLLVFVSLCLVCISMHAQKRVSIIDDETRKPIAYAVVADSADIIARSSVQGMVVIPKREGQLIFSHESYDRLTIPYDSIPSVVKMHRRTYLIDEVEVVGQGNLTIDPHAFGSPETDPVENALQAASPNGNLLGLLVEGVGWVLKKVGVDLHPKETHKQKLKEILDNY